MTVAVSKPQSRSLSQAISANGNIVAWQESIIGTQLGNLRVAEIHASVGDRVKKGQVLATFGDEQIRIDVAQAKAAVAEAESLHLEASENLQRVKALEGNGALSQQQITLAVTQESSSDARAQLARAKLAAEQLHLRQTQIVAPDDGVISARSVAVGTICPVGQEMFRMLRKGRVEWHAEVTVNDTLKIAPGVQASIQVPGGKQVFGKVRMVGPTADSRSRNVLVYVDLPDTQSLLEGLKPGMFVRGEITVGDSQALMVPGVSLVLRDGVSSVFVVDDQQTVHQMPVTPGREAGGMIEVHGVPADAWVVSKGAGFLADGDFVRREQ
jgi:RND family efflux transporter MFP subunit